MFGDLFKNVFGKTLKTARTGAKGLLSAKTSGGEFLLAKTNFGQVYVEYATIQRMAERALSQVDGMNEVDVTVEKIENSAMTPMKIQLTTALTEGYSAVKVGEAADKAINTALKEALQLEFYVPVKISVEQIKQKEIPQRRRVR
ncbi:MAG: hypothetical protein K6G55_00955 [Selenomonadaceae bacterium]|nr:hypothetical protein [Selenomonadaceae bacterium]